MNTAVAQTWKPFQQDLRCFIHCFARLFASLDSFGDPK